MSLPRLDDFSKKVSDLPDRPSDILSTSELKGWFDSSSEELRVVHNQAMDQIEKDYSTKQEVQGIVLGQVPDESMTLKKMANDVMVLFWMGV